MEITKPTEADQQKCEKAQKLLLSLIEDHQEEIELTLWMGPMIAILAKGCELSNIPFGVFKRVTSDALEFYGREGQRYRQNPSELCEENDEMDWC